MRVIFFIFLLGLTNLTMGKNVQKKSTNIIHGKKWYLVDEELSGWFIVEEDGSMLGSDGCNSCGYGKESVYFLSDGRIQWKVKSGPLCQTALCLNYKNSSNKFDTSNERKETFFLSPINMKDEMKYQIKNENNMEITFQKKIYRYSLTKPNKK